MSSKEYMNAYIKKRYAERRAWAIAHLGSKCANCGCDDITVLEFDHVDRNTKSFAISDCILWAKEKFINEINKCQLLCKKCHHNKSIVDLGKQNAREVHGTLGSYRYCKCDICKAFVSEYAKNKRKKKSDVYSNG